MSRSSVLVRRRRAVLAEKHAGVALRGHGVSVVAPERHDRAVREWYDIVAGEVESAVDGISVLVLYACYHDAVLQTGADVGVLGVFEHEAAVCGIKPYGAGIYPRVVVAVRPLHHEVVQSHLLAVERALRAYAEVGGERIDYVEVAVQNELVVARLFVRADDQPERGVSVAVAEI